MYRYRISLISKVGLFTNKNNSSITSVSFSAASPPPAAVVLPGGYDLSTTAGVSDMLPLLGMERLTSKNLSLYSDMADWSLAPPH